MGAIYQPVLYIGDISGPEGNAFVILGHAQKVAKENNMNWESIHTEATSGNYEHLLKVMDEHFNCQIISKIETKGLFEEDDPYDV